MVRKKQRIDSHYPTTPNDTDISHPKQCRIGLTLADEKLPSYVEKESPFNLISLSLAAGVRFLICHQEIWLSVGRREAVK